MTDAMRSASLASALEAAAVGRESCRAMAAVDGEVASVEGLDDLIEAIPRIALMVCSATAAELMEVESDGTRKLLSRSGAGVEAPCPRMQVPLGQPGRNLVLIVWAAPGATLTGRDLERLTVYGSLADASLARLRSSAAPRNVATLAVVRERALARPPGFRSRPGSPQAKKNDDAALTPTLLTGQTRPFAQACRDCGAAMVERETKDGRKFHGCVRFPECKGGAALITRRARSLTQRASRRPVVKTRA